MWNKAVLTRETEIPSWVEIHKKVLERMGEPLKEKPAFNFSGVSSLGKLERIGSYRLRTTATGT